MYNVFVHSVLTLTYIQIASLPIHWCWWKDDNDRGPHKYIQLYAYTLTYTSIVLTKHTHSHTLLLTCTYLYRYQACQFTDLRRRVDHDRGLWHGSREWQGGGRTGGRSFILMFIIFMSMDISVVNVFCILSYKFYEALIFFDIFFILSCMIYLFIHYFCFFS